MVVGGREGWDRGAGLGVAATCHPSEPGHDMRDTPCHILVLRWRGFLQTAQGNVGQQLC